MKIWPLLTATITLTLEILATVHAVIYKRDARSAFAWVAFIWFVPGGGAAFYFLFGINRIKRKALALRKDQIRFCGYSREIYETRQDLDRALTPENLHLDTLARLIDGVIDRPLLPGNRFERLQNGDEAYEAMLQAIEDAQDSVHLISFIFNVDRSGRRFLGALLRAQKRGVEVRVIIDAAGAQYSLRSMIRLMKRKGLRVAAFLPTLSHPFLAYVNLRNHRKILVVDGTKGFTGGINIRDNNLVREGRKDATQDLHFSVEGPVVTHLQEVFAEDWAFCTGEKLTGSRYFPTCKHVGPIFARGIDDGPDDDSDPLRWTLLAALSCAQREVRIVTPYFVPDQSFITALNLCAMRGVRVDIILPQKNNLLLVKWASQGILWQVLEKGCQVWSVEGPFDHTKLMVVDQAWVFLGSANWDMRSIRLNFEFNLEAYDLHFAGTLNEWVRKKLQHARPIPLAEINARPLPIKIRDGFARILTPYL